MNIRDVTPGDAAAVARIYAPVVTDTAISFELEPPDAEEMAARIRRITGTHVWLVAETEDGIAGYAYGTPHRARAAYRFSAETAVYVDGTQRKRGVGKALYTELFPRLAERGFFQAFAGVALPNDASVALHRSVGFERIGVFPTIGFKFGQWHDVEWFHRRLREGTP